MCMETLNKEAHKERTEEKYVLLKCLEIILVVIWHYINKTEWNRRNKQILFAKSKTKRIYLIP